MEQDSENHRQAFEAYAFEVVDQLFKTFAGNLEAMPPDQQEVVRIWRLEADMYNGGFIQYFCNWGYENFEATQKVLLKIGALESHHILATGENLIAVVKDDPRIKELWDIPKYLGDHLTAEQDARLTELDELYWKNPDDILLLAYRKYLNKQP